MVLLYAELIQGLKWQREGEKPKIQNLLIFLVQTNICAFWLCM